MIPMVDLQIQYQNMKHDIDRAVLDTMESGQFILSPAVDAFEKEASEYLGANHAVAVASGFDALRLALLAAGIAPGDEVITSTFAFIATAEAIRYIGATPVFVDIDSSTFNINPQLIEEAITLRTKAVIPAHLFGQPADLTTITAICDKYNLLMIEDCGQSFGATINGKKTGSIGAAGCFSFFPNKNLGCYGDGGLITCASGEMAERLRSLCNHSARKLYYHDEMPYSSRLDEIQAAILRVKLKHIDEFNKTRRNIAELYSDLLWDVVQVPVVDGNGLHIYHQYTVLTNYRDHIMERLARAGIASAIYYPAPLHKQALFSDAYSDILLPVAEHISNRCLSIPIYPEMPQESVRLVAKTISEAMIGL